MASIKSINVLIPVTIRFLVVERPLTPNVAKVDMPVTRRLPLIDKDDEFKERIALLVPPEFLALNVIVPPIEVL